MAMIRPGLIPLRQYIIEQMISLACCSRRERILVAGTSSSELMFELNRRGYARVTTTAHCGLPGGQYDVALVDWRQRSIKSLETTLHWLVEFLGPAGVLVVWVDPQKPATNRKLRSILEGYSFFIEAGVIHEHGSAIAARRREKMGIPRAA